jgi:hypothetical protein
VRRSPLPEAYLRAVASGNAISGRSISPRLKHDRWFARLRTMPELTQDYKGLLLAISIPGLYCFLLKNEETFAANRPVAQTAQQSRYAAGFVDKLRAFFEL